MKINKKILIPVFATAMGLSLIGGVGGAVAWYQFNTKVTSSWIGVTTADGGVLQISKDNGSTWDSYADFGSASTKLHPVTFGAMTATSALPSTAKKHPHAGETDPSTWDNAVLNTDYFQYTFKLRAKKYNPENHTYDACSAVVKFDDLHLSAVGTNTRVGDAVRVHISDGTNYKLLSINGGSINCYGALDLDGSGHADKTNNYQWETGHATELVYGNTSDTQVSTQASTLIGTNFLTVPVEGATVTFTIWLEGWQKLGTDDMAIWDITKDDGVSIQFGMKLSTPESTFVSDLA